MAGEQPQPHVVRVLRELGAHPRQLADVVVEHAASRVISSSSCSGIVIQSSQSSPLRG
jgi:hypothetical protein